MMRAPFFIGVEGRRSTYENVQMNMAPICSVSYEVDMVAQIKNLMCGAQQ